MSTGNLAILLFLGLLVIACVYAVTQMETAVLQTLLAVTCGMVATLPTAALVVVLVLRQQKKEREAMARSTPARETPPVVVIQGGAPMSMHQPGGYLAPPVAPSYIGERDFVEMVGHDFT